MNAGRLGSFRSGDRSEYLAAFALSRVAFVTPVPRAEDFGVVDYLCVLARSNARHVLPESAFYVQVKSNREPVVLSGITSSWLAEHMAHPLFICVVEKEKSQISIYSCAAGWNAVFRTRVPPQRIRLEFDGLSPSAVEAERPLEYVVNVGRPILNLTASQIESEPDVAYEVLKSWITLDAGNIALRNVGRVAVRLPVVWETNRPLDASARIATTYWYGPDFRLVERDLAPILTALAHNYNHARDSEKCKRLRALLEVMPEWLDEHGRGFVAGEWGASSATRS